jgi:hypothetical protein
MTDILTQGTDKHRLREFTRTAATANVPSRNQRYAA